MRKHIGYFLAALMGGLITLLAFERLRDDHLEREIATLKLKQDQQSQYTPQRVNYSIPAELGTDFTVAAEKTVNAVVHVKTTYELDGGYYTFDPIRHFFFGDGIYQKAPRYGAGAGSGVIMSEDGYIVTNNHVIDGASKIDIVLNDNTIYEAMVIGQDPSTDLALLKVDGKSLPKIEFGNSDELRVGEWVLAVGNPFNLESTVTAGIVSAKGRDINILANGPDGNSAVESFIQTDAAVNPGNSGGALVNTNGELIGINAAIKSNTGSYTGYSFAIPVNIVSKVVEDLLEYGAVQRGYLGVRIQDVSQALAEEKDLDMKQGVYVAKTIDLGAAKEAGILEGDIITKVASKNVRNVTELQEQVSRYRPGDEVLITVNRKGKEVEIPVTLRNQYGEDNVAGAKELELHEKLNALFADVTDELQVQLEITGGAQVKELGNGKLRSAGISPGFIILKVDDQVIVDKDQLMDILESKSGGVLIEGIYPNGKRAYYGFGL